MCYFIFISIRLIFCLTPVVHHFTLCFYLGILILYPCDPLHPVSSAGYGSTFTFLSFLYIYLHHFRSSYIEIHIMLVHILYIMYIYINIYFKIVFHLSLILYLSIYLFISSSSYMQYHTLYLWTILVLVRQELCPGNIYLCCIFFLLIHVQLYHNHFSAIYLCNTVCCFTLGNPVHLLLCSYQYVSISLHFNSRTYSSSLYGSYLYLPQSSTLYPLLCSDTMCSPYRTCANYPCMPGGHIEAGQFGCSAHVRIFSACAESLCTPQFSSATPRYRICPLLRVFNI